MTTIYKSLSAIVVDLAEQLRPPERLTVAQAAEKYRYVNQPGAYVGPWLNETAPYMVEPMNMLASRDHESLAFVGPAQCGKTVSLGEGWLAHVATNDPGDMLMVQMTEGKAREYSRQRIDRALIHSPDLEALKSSSTDNLHDKMFKHGMWLKLAWPTVTNLSSTSYRYVFLTDYDRMPADIDGEGSAFSLGVKRTTTFLSRGMCAAESSPGYPVKDPGWRPTTRHEAPPVGGILGIYNSSDRRRWYWKCIDCYEWFEAAPGLGLFGLPDDAVLLETIREENIAALAAKYSRVICPCCGTFIDFKHRYNLNRGGRWLQDGLSLTKHDEIVGIAMESKTAGYWLGGVAAAYQSWESLVSKYLQGLRTYALSGEELALQTTTNTDQGMPYTSMLLREAQRSNQDPADRADKELQRYVVPENTRFIVATVDIQGGTNAKFVVQVHAVGPHREKTVIDRYNIVLSNREGVGDTFAPIDPAGYKEDWMLIYQKVVRSTYKTPLEGKELRVRMTVIDSGGEDGVTDNAYAFLRTMRKMGLDSRVMLVKGVGRDQKAEFPYIKLTMKGARNPKEEGDVPVYLLNSNALKDVVETGRRRASPGPGYIRVPSWLPRSWWDEFYAEVRNQRGVWEQIRKRNEAFDLMYYCEAGCMRLGADKINWDADKAPTWARPLAMNSDLITVEERREEQGDRQVVPLVDAKPTARSARRRSSSSGYLSS